MENNHKNGKEELINASMSIIISAGNAREEARKALRYVRTLQFEKSEDHLVKAKKEIQTAHSYQTEIIQNEAKGIKYEYSLLFTHAQDTIMTINSELIIIEEMIEVFKALIENKTLM